MRKVILFACLFIPVCVFSQANLKEIRKSGYQVFAYEINADLAEKYIRQDSIDIDAFLQRSPDRIFPADSVDEKKLVSGQYVLLSVADNRVIANLTGVSDLYVYTINDQQRVQYSSWIRKEILSRMQGSGSTGNQPLISQRRKAIG